jgi:Fic family protein
MARLLSRADQSLGRLDGVARMLPEPDLFVAMYVRREAVYSSQIEGTQSTLDDVLEFELDKHGRDLPLDVEEVVNYIHAMNHGLQRLREFPLSLRLIREIHDRLLTGVRGAERLPGEFRTTQNWIGPANAPLRDATFIPPPPSHLADALGNLERFLHDEESLPDLLHCGVVHAQFETIHPFLDGNGRVGRLLITLLLCYRQVLQQPLLYISLYLRRHRQEYYDRLTAIRDRGDWEGWLRFFLRGVLETADEATRTAQSIVALREQHRSLLQEKKMGANAFRLIDVLFEHPIVNSILIRDSLEIAPGTAQSLLARFCELGILREITGAERNRRYRYDAYIDLFEGFGLQPDEEHSPNERSRS